MSVTVTIQNELCTGCGSCIPVCPHKLLVLTGQKAGVVDDGHCMQCGHCQAACPVQAISLDLPEQLGLCTVEERGSAKLAVDPAGLVHLMRMRRSCRNFTSQPVDPLVLQDLVKIGTTAPSGTNCQPWGFIVFEQRSAVIHLGELTAAYYKRLNRQAANPVYRFLTRLFYHDVLGNYYRNYYPSVSDALRRWEEDGEDLLFHGATSVIMVTADRRASCPVEDALLATQNMLLAAESMDIGSCLVGFVVEAAKRDKSIREAIGLSRDHLLCSVIALGYKNEKYLRPAPRKAVDPVVRNF